MNETFRFVSLRSLSGLTWFGSECFQQRFDLRFGFGEVMGYDAPDDAQINPEVLMNRDIPESNHPVPWDG
jgi:hypothetical protein